MQWVKNQGKFIPRPQKSWEKNHPNTGPPFLRWYTLTYFQLHPPKTNMVHLKMKPWSLEEEISMEKTIIFRFAC